jgi:CRISPR system Cascade subunit CasD
MPDFLAFTLAGTFASFGDVAGHERRGSWTWPGRSAILGLLAAAQGIRRGGDFAGLEALKVAVAVFETGSPLRDYHTVQTIPSAAVRRPQARPDALARARQGVNTTITLRDYRTGVLFGVALAGPGLGPIAEALERPAFHLHLGRKACPLSAPLAPRIVPTSSPEDALAEVVLPPWHAGAIARTLYADADMPGAGPAERIETRHDAALDRRLWHFGVRQVQVRSVNVVPKGGA